MKKFLLLNLFLSCSLGFGQSTARLQVIHNSADVAAEFVDIYVNDVLTFNDFEFRTATPYIDVPAEISLEIAVAPGSSSDSDDAIATFPVTFAAGETYVVVADGIVSAFGYNPSPGFSLEVYDMGREAATSGTNTDILVHHGSTDAPSVDVVEVGVGAGTIVNDISYTEFQGYLELPTADYVLEIRDETGVTTVASFDAPLSGLSLDGAALVVVASGFLNPAVNSDGAAFGLWVALPTGGALIELPATVLSVDEFTVADFVLYPSPASNVLNLELSLGITIDSIQLVDMLGRSTQIKLDNANTIDVSALSAGVYQLVMQTAEGIISKRFVKQ